MQSLPITLAVGLAIRLALITLSVHGDDREERAAFPPGVKQLYEALSTSMKTKHMPGFMKLFHISFVYEGEDRSSLDRGPWRRLWLERFVDRSYEVVAYSPGQTLENDGHRIVLLVEAVTVYEEIEEGTRQLEKVIFEDTLVRESDSWTFLERVRKRSTVGRVAPRAEIRSPRLTALARSLESDEESGLETFWAEVTKKGTPLVEPDPKASQEESKRSRVTFLWRGGRGETKVLVTSPSSAAGQPRALEQLGDSDVWYLTVSLPIHARFRYQFELATAIQVTAAVGRKTEVFTVESTSTDPLNSKTIDAMSLLELPGTPRLTALASVDGRPEGSLERETVRSKMLRERRIVSVYRPSGYDESGAAYPAVFLMDRGSYASRQSARTLLDNLIAEKKIPALVVFLLHSEGSKSADLAATSRFVDFLGTELVEWARKSCHISQKPADIVIGGNKLGGALAVHAASRYPAVFGKVLVETGDFSVCLDPVEGGAQGCAAQRFSEIPKQELRFYLAVAELESDRLVSSSWHLRDVLAARGYSARLTRFPSNHHTIAWLEALAEGLEELLGRN